MKSLKQLVIGTLTVFVLGLGATVAQATVVEAEALTTAIQFTGTVGGKSGGLHIDSSGATRFGRAQFVFNGGEGGLVGNPQATSFPFVLTGSSSFKPNVPHPPGREVSGKYLSLIVDASTNRVEESSLSPTPPPIAQLGTVVTLNLTSSEAATASTSCHVDQLLTVALARKHLARRRHSAALALRACEARHG